MPGRGRVSARWVAQHERRELSGKPPMWTRIEYPLGESGPQRYHCNKHNVTFSLDEDTCAGCSAPPKRPAWLEKPDYWVKAVGLAYDPGSLENACIGEGVLTIVYAVGYPPSCTEESLTCEWHPNNIFGPDEACCTCLAEHWDDLYNETGELPPEDDD